MTLSPEIRSILDTKCRQAVKEHRAGTQELSHDEQHLERVGGFAIRLGESYGFEPQTLALGYIAGKLHDAQRSTGENPETKDEEISGQVARNLMLILNESGQFPNTETQREAVVYAIENQGHSPARSEDPNIRDKVPPSLSERIHMLLFAGDKIAEANGPWIIARRPHFMAARLNNPDGTWQEFGFIPGRDEALVTAVETAIRMSIVSVEQTYPRQLKETIAPLFRVQREFALGLYRALGITAGEVSDILLNRIDSQTNKNILQKRKHRAPNDEVNLTSFIVDRSGLSTQAILEVENDQADSALEATNYFSSGYQQELDDLVRRWQPIGIMAKDWHQGMLWYLEGSLFDRLTA